MTGNLQPNILIVVPARGGSKRVPGKNVRPLSGRSLLDRTAAAIAASGLAAPVLLTTDAPEIASRGHDLGWTVVNRPAALATDAVASEPAVLHALDWWETRGNAPPEMILMLQPTSPFRGGRTLARAVALLAARPDAEAVVGVAALHVGPRHVLGVDDDGLVVPLCANSDRVAGPAHVPNGALYLIRAAALRQHRSFYPPRTLPLEMDAIASLDIDTEADWRLAEAVVAAGLCPVEATS